MTRLLASLLTLLLCAAAVPALAQDDAKPESFEGLRYRGWGLRGGFGFDPDQAIIGAHVDLGEFTPHLRFVPNLELGFGDDAWVISGTLPVHWVFELGGSITPYAGGGLAVGWIDHDKKGSDTEIGLKLIGGAEFNLVDDDSLILELNVTPGYIYDAQLLVGWNF